MKKEYYRIINDNEKLKGKVQLSGAKNSALKLLSAAPLATKEVVYTNMPLEMIDIQIKMKMLTDIGAIIKRINSNTISIKWKDGCPDWEVPSKYGSVRTSLLLLGSLCSRIGKAKVPLPSGCQIGKRGYDLHIMALRKLGIKIIRKKNFLIGKKIANKNANIEFPITTTGGTENAILSSVINKGSTIITCAHTRPEVRDLINCLNKMGAEINIIGSGVIEINGVKFLNGTHHKVIYDNIEAMTFVACAVVTKSKISIINFPWDDLEIPIIYLKEIGVKFKKTGKEVLVDATAKKFGSFNISTGIYPGINSDMQPLFAIMANVCNGNSHIIDNRFENRFNYIKELNKLGLNTTIIKNKLFVKCNSKLVGCRVRATDIRGGVALVIAALTAKGETIITNIKQIKRGYENFSEKLKKINININKLQ